MKKPNLKSILFCLVTVALTGAALFFHSALFGFAAVSALLVDLLAEAVHEKLFAMKNINIVIPDEYRKRLADNEAAVASIIYNAKQRGF